MTKAKPDKGGEKQAAFRPRCLSIDLEVGVSDGRIHRLAAVRGDDGQAFVRDADNLAECWQQLDDFAGDLAFLLGHNIIFFDLPRLAAARPDLSILGLPVVDTLWLNPLAFPRNPYHRLVKHYHDGRLHRGQLNDPELDARLTLEVFEQQRNAFAALAESAPDLLLAWHWLTTTDQAASGLNAFFTTLRQAPRPKDELGMQTVKRYLLAHCCATASREALDQLAQLAWPLAYVMAWLSVAGGNSVMPPWIRHQFPEAGHWLKKLRNRPCAEDDCRWCRQHHDADKELTRWFGLAEFRAAPADEQGQSLQRSIVSAAMQGAHVLGILPTGSGKSLCYQLPALSRYDKTGALTLVISPLVALMADQVAGLRARGIVSCATLNSLLSMPERSDVLDKVRLGDVAILIISPEQLRSPRLKRVLAQREIGAWVLDEAHCLSKWGHDFRPDYRYVGRFIKEWSGDGDIAPVLCLTATAKPDVISDIEQHFQDALGISFREFNGGASRSNLAFEVIPASQAEKPGLIQQLLATSLSAKQSGGVIIYCARRQQAEDLARFLVEQGRSAERYHAGLQPEEKKRVQEDFIGGRVPVITATNAFGMGIDKPDVRLVIHADIPGSLENYLQEAGRAGRDGEAARCVLLYGQDDVEKQFGMSAYARLSQRQISAILRALRRLQRKLRKAEQGTELVATSGEILAEESEGWLQRDSLSDDDRVRTALLWLEEAGLLRREENRVQVFPSSLRIRTRAEAEKKLARHKLFATYRQQLLEMVAHLIDTDADEGVSTDELMGITGLSAEGVRRALYDLERIGIANNDTTLTAFVHQGVAHSSEKRLAQATGLECALLKLLREEAPDLGAGDTSSLHLRRVSQRLKDEGQEHALPGNIWRILTSLATDGRERGLGLGSLKIKKRDVENVQLTLQREWPQLEEIAQHRRTGAAVLLGQFLAAVQPGAKGRDLLAKTTLGQLQHAIDQNTATQTADTDTAKFIDYALLWLHDQEVLRLNKGMAIFRPAMTIDLAQTKRGFVREDYAPLQQHYRQQAQQIHVMNAYAQRALADMREAWQLAMAYFRLPGEKFIRQWLPEQRKELDLQTTPESLQRIVHALNNRVQQEIVADEREQTNVLVLAGPGTGKTRVLVHRIAYLVRVRRENPGGIVAISYNRHAAIEIRRRLGGLLGNEEARRVTVLTCHALAMRMLGASFAERSRDASKQEFKALLREATALLEGKNLPDDEADVQRERLLSGFRWILVDEYQDLGAEEYALISALAGRTRDDPDKQLSLFAVGDDDQNIYAFKGASVEFIRRFEQDYRAKPRYLLQNYRATKNIIATANHIIAPAAGRMKAEHPVEIDKARTKQPAGGELEACDPTTKGRVKILTCESDRISQALVAMNELQRLAELTPDWDWKKAAVIAREWEYLEPLRSYCELQQIPVQMAKEQQPPLWRLRETRQLMSWLEQAAPTQITVPKIKERIQEQAATPWWALLHEALDDLGLEIGAAALSAAQFSDWLVEWGREMRRRQTGLLLCTAHSAKGLEFDFVMVLDGGWGKASTDEDKDAERRLYYVAMTRAAKSLSLICCDRGQQFTEAADLPAAHFIRQHGNSAWPGRRESLNQHYRYLSLEDIDIGFAGRYAPKHGIHAAIARLKPGDALQMRERNGGWEIADSAGTMVGRLAKKFSPPVGMGLQRACVFAVVHRRREDSEPQYQLSIKCDSWEVVLPLLVYGKGQ